MNNEIITNSEYIKLEHNEHKNNINLALDIVKNYIIENKLILVGGMSIHMSLLIVNKKLYDEYEIPDYDVYSDNFIYHADKLSNILCNKKLPNIALTPAIHNTTIRVKMSGYSVFDITYVPTNIYNKLPTINYLDFIIINPNYQKIDQYNSLSFLFDITGPSYNIFHRFIKDIDRNKLLVDNFNIESKSLSKIKYIDYHIPLNILNNDNHEFNIYNKDKLIYNLNDISDNNINYIYNNKDSYFETDFNICLHGITAYSFYYTKIKNILNEFNIKYKDNIKIKKQNNIFKNCLESIIYIRKQDNELFLQSSLPQNCNITFINSNNNIDELLTKITKFYQYKESDINKYNKILDMKPVSIVFNNIEILDLYSSLLSSNLTYLEFNNKKYNFIISNYNYILSYFLTNYYFNNNNNEIYLNYYSSLLNIINISKELYNIDNELFNKINGQYFENSLFNYSISTFGLENYNDSYFYFIKNFNYLYEHGKNSTLKPNNNYIEYPNCKESTQLFEIDKSDFFKIDGLLNNDMKYTNFSYILNN